MFAKPLIAPVIALNVPINTPLIQLPMPFIIDQILLKKLLIDAKAFLTKAGMKSKIYKNPFIINLYGVNHKLTKFFRNPNIEVNTLPIQSPTPRILFIIDKNPFTINLYGVNHKLTNFFRNPNIAINGDFILEITFLMTEATLLKPVINILLIHSPTDFKIFHNAPTAPIIGFINPE